MIIGLVGCGAAKLTRPAKAKDLYVGPLFKAARRYAERTCDKWYILSALHGLLDPERPIHPYNLALKDQNRAAISVWASNTGNALAFIAEPEDEFMLLASKLYGLALENLPHKVTDPMRGLPLGKRIAWLNKENGKR